MDSVLVQTTFLLWEQVLQLLGGPNTSNLGIVVAGHDSAVATAEQINKTETYRDPDSFADIVRGMHLYGRKILRP